MRAWWTSISAGADGSAAEKYCSAANKAAAAWPRLVIAGTCRRCGGRRSVFAGRVAAVFGTGLLRAPMRDGDLGGGLLDQVDYLVDCGRKNLEVRCAFVPGPFDEGVAYGFQCFLGRQEGAVHGLHLLPVGRIGERLLHRLGIGFVLIRSRRRVPGRDRIGAIADLAQPLVAHDRRELQGQHHRRAIVQRAERVLAQHVVAVVGLRMNIFPETGNELGGVDEGLAEADDLPADDLEARLERHQAQVARFFQQPPDRLEFGPEVYRGAVEGVSLGVQEPPRQPVFDGEHIVEIFVVADFVEIGAAGLVRAYRIEQLLKAHSSDPSGERAKIEAHFRFCYCKLICISTRRLTGS